MLGEECAERFGFVDFTQDVLFCSFDVHPDWVREFVESMVGSEVISIDFDATRGGLLVGLLVGGGCGGISCGGWGTEEAEG